MKESGQDSCDSLPEDNISPNEVKDFKTEPFDEDALSSESDTNDAFLDSVAY